MRVREVWAAALDVEGGEGAAFFFHDRPQTTSKAVNDTLGHPRRPGHPRFADVMLLRVFPCDTLVSGRMGRRLVRRVLTLPAFGEDTNRATLSRA